MLWTTDAVREKFGEDVLRDICRDVNDLMSGRAGHGHQPNRIGVPQDLWHKLLRAGGYTELGASKALKSEHLRQEDTEGPFTPYTILTLTNLSSENGGPLSPEEVDALLTCALSYRQLI